MNTQINAPEINPLDDGIMFLKKLTEVSGDFLGDKIKKLNETDSNLAIAPKRVYDSISLLNISEKISGLQQNNEVKTIKQNNISEDFQKMLKKMQKENLSPSLKQ